jgi:hypothetical protein
MSCMDCGRLTTGKYCTACQKRRSAARRKEQRRTAAGTGCVTCGRSTPTTLLRDECGMCYQERTHGPSQEEVDRIVAEQMANLPDWWQSETDRMNATAEGEM